MAMKIETVAKRLESAKKNLQNKEDQITKKITNYNKLVAEFNKKYGEEYDPKAHYTNDDMYWDSCKIGSIDNTVFFAEKDIKSLKEKVAKYEAQMATFTASDKEESKKRQAEKKEKKKLSYNDMKDIWDNKIPSMFKGVQKELADKWTEFDIAQKDRQDEDMGWTRTPEQIQSRNDRIRRDNEFNAKQTILDLYIRVIDKIGDIKGWENLTETCGRLGGKVIGETGTAKVSVILAGGYNIQRLHVRTLVKVVA